MTGCEGYIRMGHLVVHWWWVLFVWTGGLQHVPTHEQAVVGQLEICETSVHNCVHNGHVSQLLMEVFLEH